MSNLVTPDAAELESARPGDSALDPIPLPETRRVTSGRRRREVRRRRQRRQGMGAMAAIAAVLILVLAIGAGAVKHQRDTRVKKATTAPVAAVAPFLLGEKDAAGNVVVMTILVPAADGKGGAIVLVPPGTMTEVVSADLQPISRALAVGGPAQLRTTTENLLGVALGDVAIVDGPGMSALVSAAGPLTVNLPTRVETVEPSGTVDVVYEAGPKKINPADVPQLLSEKGRGTDLDRLARHQAFFDAWFTQLGRQPSAIPAEPAALHRALVVLSAGPMHARVLPVSSVGTTAETGELYKPDNEELRRMVAATFPTAKPGGVVRPRVQLLNGTGALGLAARVATKLGPSFEVALTANAPSFDFTETKIVFYDKAKQSMAQRVRDQLGVGTLVFSRTPLDVVDVTVVVGKDFS